MLVYISETIIWNLFLILYVEQIIIFTTVSSALLLDLRETLLLFWEVVKLPLSRADILLHFFSGKYLCFTTLSEVVRQRLFEPKK